MKFSPWKVFWNDWPTLAASLGIPIVWAIHFAFPLLKKTSEPPLFLPIVISVLLISVTIWRFTRVSRLFNKGFQTLGIIEDIVISKDRGRLIYSFTVEGNHFSSWHPIHKSKQILSMYSGQTVTVLYDPLHPAYSIVKDLFQPE